MQIDPQIGILDVQPWPLAYKESVCFQHLLFITCFRTPVPGFVRFLRGIAEPICLLSFKGIFAELLKAAKMKNNQTQVKEGTPAAWQDLHVSVLWI